jgi:hypothetical protein
MPHAFNSHVEGMAILAIESVLSLRTERACWTIWARRLRAVLRLLLLPTTAGQPDKAIATCQSWHQNQNRNSDQPSLGLHSAACIELTDTEIWRGGGVNPVKKFQD